MIPSNIRRYDGTNTTKSKCHAKSWNIINKWYCISHRFPQRIRISFCHYIICWYYNELSLYFSLCAVNAANIQQQIASGAQIVSAGSATNQIAGKIIYAHNEYRAVFISIRSQAQYNTNMT